MIEELLFISPFAMSMSRTRISLLFLFMKFNLNGSFLCMLLFLVELFFVIFMNVLMKERFYPTLYS